MKGIIYWIVLFSGLCSSAFALHQVQQSIASQAHTSQSTRSSEPNRLPEFLTISDIHYGSDNTTKDGHDIGPEFLHIALGQFKKLQKQASFILVLGDLPSHSLFNNPKKEAFERVVFHGLYEADQDKKPMFYITGNNDSLGGNYQPFTSTGKSPLSLAVDWSGACAYCEGLLIDESAMRSNGYYSTYVIPGNKNIILIALNSNQFIKPSFFYKYPHQDRDATEQLKWLEIQLRGLHAKQLIIAMHIPPGLAYNGQLYWQERSLYQLITLLDRYHSSYGQITLLSAHTHMDEIRVLHLHNGTPLYVYATPSIGLNHHNNPGMKLFQLDAHMAVKNYTTYYTTNLKSWGTEQYQALGSSASIFPHCTTHTLSQCLESLSDEQICNILEHNLFYGVKSSRVPQNVCHTTFRVN